MKAAWGALLAAGAASVCCIAPVAGVMLGAGAMTAVAMRFEPYRPVLLGATVVLLGIAFVAVYRPHCDAVCSPRTRRFVWLVAAVAILLVAFPYYIGWLL